jgi:hypothetical protein
LGDVSDALTEALELLVEERGVAARISERSILLGDPVNGDPRLAALRVLGVAHAASPVGAATYGADGVGAGVWRVPELYLVGWTHSNRWLTRYRLTGGATPNDYVRAEGRIPSHLETGNWFKEIPDEARDAFAEVGLSLDEPPFPLPPPPPPPAVKAKPASSARAPRTPSTRRSASPAAPRRQAAPKPPPVVRVKTSEDLATRLCAGCNFRKVATQFEPGSDLCVDCR